MLQPLVVSRQQLAASKGAHVGRPFGIMGVPIIHDKRCGTRRLPIRPGFPGISREPVLKELCDAQNRVSRLCRIS